MVGREGYILYMVRMLPKVPFFFRRICSLVRWSELMMAQGPKNYLDDNHEKFNYAPLQSIKCTGRKPSLTQLWGDKHQQVVNVMFPDILDVTARATTFDPRNPLQPRTPITPFLVRSLLHCVYFPQLIQAIYSDSTEMPALDFVYRAVSMREALKFQRSLVVSP